MYMIVIWPQSDVGAICWHKTKVNKQTKKKENSFIVSPKLAFVEIFSSKWEVAWEPFFIWSQIKASFYFINTWIKAKEKQPLSTTQPYIDWIFKWKLCQKNILNIGFLVDFFKYSAKV